MKFKNKSSFFPRRKRTARSKSNGRGESGFVACSKTYSTRGVSIVASRENGGDVPTNAHVFLVYSSLSFFLSSIVGRKKQRRVNHREGGCRWISGWDRRVEFGEKVESRRMKEGRGKEGKVVDGGDEWVGRFSEG